MPPSHLVAVRRSLACIDSSKWSSCFCAADGEIQEAIPISNDSSIYASMLVYSHMGMREPQQIGADLREWLNRHGLSEVDLVGILSNENNGLTISQSWLSRIT